MTVRTVLLVGGLAALTSQGAGAGEHDAAKNFWREARPADVCAMSAAWVIGVGHELASVTHSHIDRIDLPDGGRALQALHRGTEAQDAVFDQFLVEADTLSPISTTHTGPDPDVRFEFEAGAAARIGPDGDRLETIAFGEPPLPEGPGLEIAAQAIAWRDGLRLKATMLDRWRGEGEARRRSMTWVVEGRESIDTLSGRHEVFRTRLAPVDTAFDIEAYITVGRPHAIVRMAYRRAPGANPLVSELREFAFNCVS